VFDPAVTLLEDGFGAEPPLALLDAQITPCRLPAVWNY